MEQKGIQMEWKPTRRVRLTLPRREFLKTAGVAVAAPYVVTSAAVGADGQLPPSERITTALIGSGGRGQQIMAGGDRVVAVCDVDAKHRAASKAAIDSKVGDRSCAAYTDFRHVLARRDIDAVVVATPDHWHVPIAIAAVKAGKAVYVEKPLSLTIREGRIMADAVRRYNAIVQVGSQQRSPEYENFTKACELVRNGRIGDLQTIGVDIFARSGNDDPWKPRPVPVGFNYNMWLGPAPWSPYHPNRCHYKFRFVTDFSGGDITNWGAHHLDIAQWAIGADDSGPLEIVGSGRRNATGMHDTFYDIHVDFTYASGVKVELRSGGTEMKTGGVRLQGTEGWIHVTREGINADPASLLESRIGPDEIHLAPEDRHSTHMGNWLDCVRTGNASKLNVPVEVGHRSATVCHLANIAMDLGRKLNWDPAKEEFVDDDQANLIRWRPMRQPWGL